MEKLLIEPASKPKEGEPFIIPNDIYALIKSIDALTEQIQRLVKATNLNG